MDIDGDGYRDILSGSYSRMDQNMAGLFQVLHGQKDGSFRAAQVLKGSDGEPLIIPIKDREVTQNICTRPFAVDWDGDGHLDLVVGNFAGSFYWFKGLGSGRFEPRPEQLKIGSEPLRINGVHSDPFVIDWDGDGDLDLLSGSSNGGVQWAENRAGTGKRPELRSFRTLIEAGRRFEHGAIVRDEDLKAPAGMTRIWVDDVNGDGQLDILVGDSVTLLSPAKGLTEDEMKKRVAAWQKTVNDFQEKHSAVLRSDDGDSAERTRVSQEFSKLYQQRSEFVLEEPTGFVWLYLQKTSKEPAAP